MQSVNVPGVGLVNFPDGMSQQDIINAIERDILPSLQAKQQPAPKTTLGGEVKEFLKGIPAGAIGLGETAIAGASALLPEEYEKAVRESVGTGAAALKKPFEAAPGYEDTVGRKLGQAVGSTVPFFAAAPFGVPGMLAGAATGVAAGAGEARVRAEEKGATGEERALATALGIGPGLLDLVAPELKIGKTIITRALMKGGVEGATEAAQNVAQNLIAKGLYDPEQPILQGTAEEGAYGAGAGALASFLVDTVAGRRARVGPSEKPEEAPTAPPIATAAQMPLGGVPEFTEGYEGYRMPPEPYREAEEKEGDRQNRLFQITELRDQHDVLMREIDRLKAQFESPTATPEQKQAILEQADKYNAARADLQAQIKQLSKGLEDTERAGAVATPEQRGLDFDMPAMPRQQTGEGVVLGEQPAAPALMAPEQIEFFRQQRIKSIQDRMVAGEAVTPADMAFLQMDEREQRALFEAQPTPDLFVGEERPEFRLGPQYLTPAPAEAAPVAEARPVTENDFKAMGIGATNKKLREALLGKDLTDPTQRAEVREMLSDFANHPNRSQRIIEGVEKFLTSPAFMEQGELDFGKPKRTRTKKATGVSNVIEPAEPIAGGTESGVPVVDERGEVPAGGVEETQPGGVDVSGEPAGRVDAGETVQPPALTETPAPAPTAPALVEGKMTPKDAVKRLMQEGGLKRAEAVSLAADITDGYGEVASKDVDDEINKLKAGTEPAALYTPEQRAVAEGHAKDFGAEIIWQEGDNALLRGYGEKTGKPMYFGTRGQMYTTGDVEDYKGTKFSKAEIARMVAEKKKAEKAASDAHKQKPFIAFNKNHIQTSQNTPKELANIVAGWAKLLGLKTNIYITTMEDIAANKGKFTGPHRAIEASLLDTGNLGETRKLSDGSHYIAFTKSTSLTSMLETLAHELGHVHMKEMYKNASPQLQQSIRAEFEKWLVAQKGKTARELVDSLRAKTVGKQTIVEEGQMADTLKPYWREFDEWYADQVSRWATTDKKPISVVEKFFARLGQALRKFFSQLKNQKYLANETFVQYLSEVKKAAKAQAAAPGEVSPMLKGAFTNAAANLKKWFGNSVVRNADGSPKLMYHGTARDISEFRPKQAGAIFVTDDPRFAEGFAYQSEEWMQRHAEEFFTPAQIEKFRKEGAEIAKREGTDASDETARLMVEALPSNANIIPVYVRAEKPFDYENPEHIERIRTEFSKILSARNEGGSLPAEGIRNGLWSIIENKDVQAAIRASGFDSFYVYEGGRKNLAVYESNQLKSPYNSGAYDLSDPRISYQKRTVEAEPLTDAGKEAAALNERMKGIANEPNADPDETLLARVTMAAGNLKNFPMQFRQAVVDKDAPVKERLSATFNKGLRDQTGGVNPVVFTEQAQEATGLADQLMRRGGIRIGKDGLVEIYDRKEGGKDISLDAVFTIIIDKLGKRLGSAHEAVKLAHRAFIAQRAAELKKHNAQLRAQADAAEAKGNKKAAEKLRAQIITVRAKDSEIAAGLEAMQKFPELKEAFDTFTKYNEGVIDFLVASGRLSEAQANEWKDNIGYVPWTRVEEETSKLETVGKLRTGNVHLASLPQLDKEGSSKEIRNVLDNMVGHTISAIRSGMKNRAAIKTLDVLDSAHELKTQDEVDYALKNNRNLVVFAYRNGERVAFKLDNEVDLPAFSNVVDVAGPILSVFKGAATGLRSFVTHMPTFALSQLSQDTVRAMFLSGVKHPFSIPSKVMSNFYKAVTGGLPEIEALGITGAYDGMPEHAMRRARERHGLQDRSVIGRVWDKLEDFSLAADMAVRAAIYEQTMHETGDRVLAFHRAKEYINFKTAGNGQTVRILRQVVPFMNAYIQGMDILYRTIQGKGLAMEDRKAAIALFLTTGMKVAALSTLYAMLVGDDDDYKGLDDHERDNNFIIPGTGLKIPVAPEIGFLFKVIPERIYQKIAREGTDRPIDNTTFLRGMRDAAINAYGGMNMTPQAVKPLIEVATNHSFFTGNPIVGINMAGKETALQFNDHTSELAKLAGYVGISPMKVDHLLRGYLGTVGGVILDVTDAVVDPNRMNKPINKLPLIKTFMYDDTGKGYKTEFYAFREDVDKVVESVNSFKREGRAQELEEYLTPEKMDLYAMKGIVNKIEEKLGQLRKYRNVVANDPDLSGEEKRAKVDEILKMEKELLIAYNIPAMKKMAGM